MLIAEVIDFSSNASVNAPENWEKRTDSITGKVYWYNKYQNISRDTPPGETKTDVVTDPKNNNKPVQPGAPIASGNGKNGDPWDSHGAKPDKKPDAKPDTTPSVSGAPLKGSLVVNSPFGMRKGVHHGGVDLAASSGTSVYSPIKGKITFNGVDGNCGNTIIVDNGTESHQFCHLSSMTARKGQLVQAGDQIATSGGSLDQKQPGRGRTTDAHLHWIKKVKGQLVDPMVGVNTSPTPQDKKSSPTSPARPPME
jgi:murein DD-endopeptidase MepM/ murein hydrolase activator NlpD